jgi:prolyl-tRNA editing enzyme YbaK/EbsC (Cys-tRNA(Pro) deacylase)
MRTPEDLAQFIADHGIAATLVVPGQETPTVSSAAQALDCAEDQIIKSVLFMVNVDSGQVPAVVITNGSVPIDYHKLSGVFGISRRRIRLASPETVLAYTGYPAGGVPPFGYPTAIATYIDRHVLEQSVVYGGAGDAHTLLRVASAELIQVTGAAIVDVRAGEAGGS